MPQTINFVFGTPFIAKEACETWEETNALLAATLRSVFQQSDEYFRIAIACHDTPEIDDSLLNDPRLTLLRSGLPVPHDKPTKRLDKGHKKNMLGQYLHKLEGGLLMFLDADDLVHQDLVTTCKQGILSGTAPHGYLLTKGYMLENSKLRNIDNFNQVCGSSAVIRFEQADLPATLPEDPSIEAPATCYFDQFKAHKTWGTTAAEAGRPLEDCPLRSVIYRRNEGSISRQYFKQSLKTRIAEKLRYLKDGVPLTAERKAAFGME